MVRARKKDTALVSQKGIRSFLNVGAPLVGALKRDNGHMNRHRAGTRPAPTTILQTTHSEKETSLLAKKLGRKLKAGDVIALTGPIGAGKTVFIKGLAQGLGVKNPDEVKSPTFVLLHLYEGRFPIQHFDLYRLERQEELEGIGFDDFLSRPEAVTLVEWADKAKERIPQNSLWIHLKVTGPHSRNIVIAPNEGIAWRRS